MSFSPSIALICLALPPISLCYCDAPVEGDPNAATDAPIQELIEQLASRNSPPSEASWLHLTYGDDIPNDLAIYPEDWNEEHQDRVHEARRELFELGKAAFPRLLENLDDSRYSYTAVYSRPINLSVGRVRKQIIESNVDIIGMRYKIRTGADGDIYMYPNFFVENYGGDLGEWWHDNQHKTLHEMQLEHLQWLIAEEEQRGFLPLDYRNWGEEYMAELAEKRKALENRE